MTTNSKYVIDAYAWIEYILGSEKGVALKKIIAGEQNKIFTLESTFAEIKEWCLRENYDFEIIYPKIRQNTYEVPLFLDNWLAAADIKFEMRKTKKDFGLIDALLLAYQKRSGSVIVTGDPHFRGLKEVKYIG